jgi:hypothetical protein
LASELLQKGSAYLNEIGLLLAFLHFLYIKELRK